MNEVDKKINSYLKRARALISPTGSVDGIKGSDSTNFGILIARIAEMIQREEHYPRGGEKND